MLGVLKELKSRVQVSRGSQDRVSVDTVVSALHHRVTSAILLVCCTLVSSRQYFGDPILCIQSGPGDDPTIPTHVLNTYCFVSSSYTVVGHSGETWQGHGSAERRHAYYQWVPFVLFVQALLFASPHAAWRNWEGGLVRGSLTGLRDDVRGPGRDKLRTLARYFTARLHTFRIWATGFYVCQLLNLLNVVVNVFLTDQILGGNFFHYGLKMSQYGLEILETSPAETVFPKVTKCMFRKYGPSGTIQNHDALCVMALNVVNEKIFMALWLWFAFLALVSALSLLWRLTILGLLACTSVHSRSFVSVWAQRVLGAPVTLEPTYLSPVTQSLDCGDWLFLQLLAANMGSRVYRDFMEQLVQAMEQVRPSDLRPIWNS